MVSTTVKVKNSSGLHARPASIFVKCATAFDSSIHVRKDGTTINGKSMLGLLSISVNTGDEIEIIAKGTDEQGAIEAIEKLFNETLVD